MIYDMDYRPRVPLRYYVAGIILAPLFIYLARWVAILSWAVLGDAV